MTGRPRAAVLALAGAACGASHLGPVNPIAEIGRCSDRAVVAVGRPGGPRTPPPALWAPGCNPFRPFALPVPTSLPPRPDSPPAFRAGFGKVDITPAPGLGTLGWGPEAGIGMGHRNRLKARAMVLQDAAGQVVAFVVIDLDGVSALLQREVAARVLERTDSAIGADRLILSATHTHSAPGGFLSAWTHNLVGTPVAGFDTAFVRGVAQRIAVAVDTAYRRMRRSRNVRAAWVVTNVWGRTRNRMLEAHRRNPDGAPLPVVPPNPPAPVSLSDSAGAVNPRWVMFRVDTLGPDGASLPVGTYSVFAMHGTMVPGGNDLYDSDIHGMVTRALEDSLGGIHLLANGAEGDVSPGWTRRTRCPPPPMDVHPRPQGPRTPHPMVDWLTDTPARTADCLPRALEELEALSDSLVRDAVGIFGSATGFSSDVRVRLNFETVHLTGPVGRHGGLCGLPQAGMSLAAGADDGRTRFNGWQVLGLWPLGISWGSVDDRPELCQDPKRALLPFLQARPVASLQFPEYTHFAVVQVGNLWLGTVPAEATTVAGRQMMAAMRRGVAQARRGPTDLVPSDSLAIVGLANGYLGYITTWDEYQAQTYEGGSTLYGPHSAGFIAGRLERLAAGMASPTTNPVDGIVVRPGPVRKTRLVDPAPIAFDSGAVRVHCDSAEVRAWWNDAAPGLFTPAEGPMVRFLASPNRGPPVTAADDHVRVEVRAVERRGRRWRWEARWRLPSPLASGDRVRVEFPRWPGAATECVRP